VATKIKLMRLGKMRAPYYRIVVADARTKRDGRSIETIGKYHPKEDPSFIEVDAERAPAPMKVAAPKADKKAIYEEAARAAMGEPAADATTPKKKAAPKADAATAPAEAVAEAAGAAGEGPAAGGPAATPAE
jgi:small subunit ribosomal protein S16